MESATESGIRLGPEGRQTLAHGAAVGKGFRNVQPRSFLHTKQQALGLEIHPQVGYE